MSDPRQEKLKKLESHLQSVKSLSRDLSEITEEDRSQDQSLLDENERLKKHIILVEDMVANIWVNQYSEQKVKDINELYEKAMGTWLAILQTRDKSELNMHRCEVYRVSAEPEKDITCLGLGKFQCPNCANVHFCQDHIDNHTCKVKSKTT